MQSEMLDVDIRHARIRDLPPSLTPYLPSFLAQTQTLRSRFLISSLFSSRHFSLLLSALVDRPSQTSRLVCFHATLLRPQLLLGAICFLPHW